MLCSIPCSIETSEHHHTSPLGFRVQGFGFRVRVLGHGSVLGCRVYKSLKTCVQSFGSSRVGFKFHGSEFRVEVLGLTWV